MNMFSSNKAWPVKSARLTKRWAFGYCSAFHLGKVDIWQVFIYECAVGCFSKDTLKENKQAQKLVQVGALEILCNTL